MIDTTIHPHISPHTRGARAPTCANMLRMAHGAAAHSRPRLTSSARAARQLTVCARRAPVHGLRAPRGLSSSSHLPNVRRLRRGGDIGTRGRCALGGDLGGEGGGRALCGGGGRALCGGGDGGDPAFGREAADADATSGLAFGTAAAEAEATSAACCSKFPTNCFPAT